MSDSLPAELAEKIRLTELDCHLRSAKIRQSGSMKDIAQLKDVLLRGELREKSYLIRGLTQLSHAAETRMRELLDNHMMELRAQTDVQIFEQLRSHFVHREWAFMKGPFPLLYREAESESEKLLRRMEQAFEAQKKRIRGKT